MLLPLSLLLLPVLCVALSLIVLTDAVRVWWPSLFVPPPLPPLPATTGFVCCAVPTSVAASVPHWGAGLPPPLLPLYPSALLTVRWCGVPQVLPLTWRAPDGRFCSCCHHCLCCDRWLCVLCCAYLRRCIVASLGRRSADEEATGGD